jgi:hypothetical protein
VGGAAVGVLADGGWWMVDVFVYRVVVDVCRFSSLLFYLLSLWPYNTLCLCAVLSAPNVNAKVAKLHASVN